MLKCFPAQLNGREEPEEIAFFGGAWTVFDFWSNWREWRGVGEGAGGEDEQRAQRLLGTSEGGRDSRKRLIIEMEAWIRGSEAWT